VPDYKITVRRDTAGWTIVALMVIVGVIAAVGFGASAPPGGARTTANLSVVPTMRYVTVSPARTKFTHCKGGTGRFRSTHASLGYPNANCRIGNRRSRPIKIKSRPRPEVLVWGYNAVPADGGTQWRLCNPGAADPAIACKGPNGLPGKDQFVVVNYWRGGQHNIGLTDAQQCSVAFASSSDCLRLPGQSQRESLKVIGPTAPHDNSTFWRIRIFWIAVPP
jgi:hypothetical protein